MRDTPASVAKRHAVQKPLADTFNELITSLADGRQLSPANNARVTTIYTELSKLDEKRGTR